MKSALRLLLLGRYRGPERLADPAFDVPAAWSAGVGWTVSGGKLTASGAAANTFTAPAAANTITADKWYQVAVVCDSVTAGSWKILQEGGASYFGTKTTAGTFQGVLQATATGGIYIWADTILSASFTEISVREVRGNHAT